MFIYLNIYKKVYLAWQIDKKKINHLRRKPSEHFEYKSNLPEAGSSEALFVKTGVPINKTNQNSRKIPVKELIFTKVTN